MVDERLMPPPWAARVFPEAPAADRVGLLWDAIFRMCRVDAGDPAAAWKEHIDRLERRRELLTEKAYSSLHYRAPGTDLTVGLPVDLLVYRRDSLEVGLQQRLTEENEYFRLIRENWSEALKSAYKSIPAPPWF